MICITHPLYPSTIFKILSFISSKGTYSTLGLCIPLCSGVEAWKSSMTFSNLNMKYVLNCDHEILDDIGNTSLHVIHKKENLGTHFLTKHICQAYFTGSKRGVIIYALDVDVLMIRLHLRLWLVLTLAALSWQPDTGIAPVHDRRLSFLSSRNLSSPRKIQNKITGNNPTN